MCLGVTPLPSERHTFHIIIVVTGLGGNLAQNFWQPPKREPTVSLAGGERSCVVLLPKGVITARPNCVAAAQTRPDNNPSDARPLLINCCETTSWVRDERTPHPTPPQPPPLSLSPLPVCCTGDTQIPWLALRGDGQTGKGLNGLLTAGLRCSCFSASSGPEIRTVEHGNHRALLFSKEFFGFIFPPFSTHTHTQKKDEPKFCRSWNASN